MQSEAGTPLRHDAPDPVLTDSVDDGHPTTGEGRTPSPEVARRAKVLLALVAVITLVADQASKIWSLDALADGRRVELVGELLSLRLIRNSGAAFSIGDGITWFMTVVAVAVTVAIVVWARRLGSRVWGVALGLVLGGSLGNLGDRFFREPGPLRGHVIDFIDYGGLFIGNVADIAIVVGAAVLVWLTLRNVGIDGVRPRHEKGHVGKGDDPATSDEGVAHD